MIFETREDLDRCCDRGETLRILFDDGGSSRVRDTGLRFERLRSREQRVDDDGGHDDRESDGDSGAEIKHRVLERVLSSFTERERFGSARDDPKTSFDARVSVGHATKACGVHDGVWTAFLDSGIRELCPWEFEADEACRVGGEGFDPDFRVPARVAYLFELWVADEFVRSTLIEQDMLREPVEGDVSEAERNENDDDDIPESDHDIIATDGADPATDIAIEAIHARDGELGRDPAVQAGWRTARPADEIESPTRSQVDSSAEHETDRLLREKFGADDSVIKGMKSIEAGRVYYKWSSIGKIARVGNQNFKKFKATKRFVDAVPPGLGDECIKVGIAHMMSAALTAKVLAMCDRT